MECHKCPFDGKGDARCIDCVSGNGNPVLSNHGQDFISADTLVGKRSEPRFDPTDAMLAAVDEREGQADNAGAFAGISPAAVAVLADFLKQLLLLDPREWCVLSFMVEKLFRKRPGNPPTLSEIGRKAADWLHYPKPISKQEVKFILSEVFTKVPTLAVLFPRMSVTYRDNQRLRRAGVTTRQSKRWRGEAQQGVLF